MGLRLEEMTKIAHAFKFVTVDGATRTPAELVADPLHRWTDPTRPFSGELSGFASPAAGRLRSSVSSFMRAWSLEFVSLSTGLVEAQDGQLHWHPQTAGVEFREVTARQSRPDDQPKRLRQIRDLVKRITASEFYDAKHYSLRLLPHPVDRYADPDSGVIDGAMFIYANGTNPEILVLIEARRKGAGLPAWSYAAAPLTAPR